MTIIQEINRINNVAYKNYINHDDVVRRASNLFYQIRKEIIRKDNENLYEDLKVYSVNILLCVFFALYKYNKEKNNVENFNLFMKKYKKDFNNFEDLFENINNGQIIEFVSEDSLFSISQGEKFIQKLIENAYNKFRSFLALYYSRDINDENINEMINGHLCDLIYELSIVVVGTVSGKTKYGKELTDEEKLEFIKEIKLLILENDWVVFTPNFLLLEELNLRKSLLSEIKQSATIQDLIKDDNEIKMLSNQIFRLEILNKGC